MANDGAAGAGRYRPPATTMGAAMLRSRVHDAIVHCDFCGDEFDATDWDGYDLDREIWLCEMHRPKCNRLDMGEESEQ